MKLKLEIDSEKASPLILLAITIVSVVGSIVILVLEL